MRVFQRNRSRWALILSLLLGVLALLAGTLLIARSASSYTGSPGGWFLVAAGIIGILTAFGITVGAYNE